jgi:hypothetical protein
MAQDGVTVRAAQAVEALVRAFTDGTVGAPDPCFKGQRK